MANGTRYFLKTSIGIWGKKLAEVAAVCFVMGCCLPEGQLEEPQAETIADEVADVVDLAVVVEEEEGADEKAVGVDEEEKPDQDGVEQDQIERNNAEQSSEEQSSIEQSAVERDSGEQSDGEQRNVDEESTVGMERYDLGDMDGNGEAEYIEINNAAHYLGPSYLRFYFNGEVIYEYEDTLNILDIEDTEYLDLDQDGEKEIIFSFCPAVNSAPLMEYAVLKRTDDGWKALEMIHGEDMLDNAFPISCCRGKEEDTVVIACEGLNKQIVLTTYHGYGADEESGGKPLKDYKEGEQCGNISAWGVVEIHSGTYEGRNCLIAMHWLNRWSEEWNCIDEVSIYFDYNEAGLVNVLDMRFMPWDSHTIVGTTEG